MQVTQPSAQPEELEAALQRLLDSASFAGSARQQRFLRHLVASVQSGQTAALKESVLAIDQPTGESA